MKNFRLYILLALLLMAGKVTIKAQDYVSILQEGNEWNTLCVVSAGLFIEGYSNYVNWCSGDTLIDGAQYTKLMGHFRAGCRCQVNVLCTLTQSK